MRGTLVQSVDAERGDGIIPAYAGNTSNTRLRVRTPRDHPRVCGEHDFDSSKFGGDLGSSPRMRGTHELFDGFGQAAGIIPAYAGNTSLLTRFSSMSQDHPRVCGEHFIEQTDAPRIVGSSPRMRGTPVLRSFRGLRMGIIPAYAGNTGRQSCRPFWRRDHPRVCGEHSQSVGQLQPWVGSSPRMRGTRVMQCDDRACGGIIPAYAGNTRRP